VWDGAANEGLGELVTPPLQVFIEVTDGVMWHERTRTTDAKHGFQRGKVSPSIRQNETGMKQLAM
jgi:hypothetical protein